ncbi:MAG: porin [Gammaproteobacteria bacterium]|nr:MAG: porin [Gammaproteobacteria bacterium]
MKKKLIALAVAGAVTAPLAAQADVTIFGSLRPSINFVDPDDGDSTTAMASNQSDIGVKGKEDLGGGLKAIFFIDFQFDESQPGDTPTGRDQYVGLQGGFGRLVFGSTSTSYKSSGAAIDPLWRTSAQARATLNMLSGLHKGNGRHGGRMQNMIRYDSPSFAGAKVVAWTGLDDSTQDNHEWGAGLHYKNGPFFGAVDYWDGNEDSGEDQAWKISGKVNFGNFAFYGAYEFDEGLISQVEGINTAHGLADFTAKDADFLFLGASAKFGNNLAFLEYGRRDDSDQGNDGTDSWVFALAHAFSKRTLVYAGYGSVNDSKVVAKDPGLDVATVGMVHKF